MSITKRDLVQPLLRISGWDWISFLKWLQVYKPGESKLLLSKLTFKKFQFDGEDRPMRVWFWRNTIHGLHLPYIQGLRCGSELPCLHTSGTVFHKLVQDWNSSSVMVQNNLPQSHMTAGFVGRTTKTSRVPHSLHLTKMQCSVLLGVEILDGGLTHQRSVDQLIWMDVDTVAALNPQA